MYGTNMQTPHRMLSYTTAHLKWTSIKPVRGRNDRNTRPLARRSNDNLTIRKDQATGDIVVTLYHTDIIRYSAEGDGYNNLITLNPYPSVMTNRVVWSILGPHVTTYWTERSYGTHTANLITEVGGRYYNTPAFATVQPAERGWQLAAGSAPFDVPRIDLAAAKKELKAHNYYRFKLWLQTQVRLGLSVMDERLWKVRPGDFVLTPSEATSLLLKGETGWVEIARRMYARGNLNAQLEVVRRAVYQSEYCYITEKKEYFTSHKELTNALKQMRKHS
jgi:hypothetical protein